MTSDPRVRGWGGARGQNLVHLQNVVSNPYLNNYLSLGIHTCTIETLMGKLSFYDIRCQGLLSGRGARGHN